MTDAWIIELSVSAYEGSNTYLIWYEDQSGRSRVYTVNDKTAVFSRESSARDTIIRLGLCCKDTVMFDLERLDYWVFTGSRSQIQDLAAPTQMDHRFLLDFWNLFDDIHYSLSSVFEPVITKRSRRCYNKLFCGADPPVPVDGNTNAPVFTK